MKLNNRIAFKFLPLLFAVIIYSCDFFAPYDLQFIELSDEEINFELFETEKQFVVTYADSFDVSWEITQPEGWIQITPMNGIINIDDPDTITVKVLRENLTPGEYLGSIEINFQDKSNTKSVSVEMQIKALPNISTKNFSFSNSDSISTFALRNDGNYPLKWKFTSNQDWVSIEPDTGILKVDSTKFLAKVLSENETLNVNDTSITISIIKQKLEVGPNEGIIELKTEAGIDTINVIASKAAAPLLTVNTNSLDFGEDLTEQIITVDNLGEEELNWSASKTESWITVTPTSGSIINSVSKTSSQNKTNADQIEINVDRSGLPPGNYNSTVEIESNGGDETVEISMVVPEMPVLAVEPASLDFGFEEFTKQVKISNSGTGTLHWNASSAESWISFTPAGDSISTGSQDLNIDVLRLGLQPGSYEGTVAITSDGGAKTISVKMNIGQFPELSYSPKTISLSVDKTESSFEIENVGEGELKWELNATESWIELSRLSGTTTNEPETIDVSANLDGLEPGNTYDGSIEITSDFGNGTIEVSISIPDEDPELSYSPSSLNFSDEMISSTFEIKNTGQSDLHWEITADESWINLGTRSGSNSPNEKRDIEVSINSTGLSPGDYSGNIDISSDGGNGRIKVNLTLSEDPVLDVGVKNLNFGDTDSSLVLEIFNKGTGRLEWQATADEDWISLQPASGNATSDQSSVIKVEVSRSGLASGNYSGNINLSSNGGEETVRVSMSVKSAPKLFINQSRLSFTAGDTSSSFEIRNTGESLLEWKLSADESWIVLPQESGTTNPDERTEVTVKVDRDKLTAGNYSGKIQIISNGGEEEIAVNLSIKSAADLFINPVRLSFGISDSSDSFEIRNIGETTLEWKLSANESWIILPSESGTTGAKERTDIIVKIDRSGLESGKYSGKVFISSNGGNEVVDIDLIVDVEPVLFIKQTKLNLGDQDTLGTFNIENTGNGILEWKLESENSWLYLSVENGFTDPDSSTEIQIYVDRKELESGSYSGKINVISNGGEEIVDVSIRVSNNPRIEVSEKKMDFGTDIDELSFIISNAGTGTLNWKIEQPETWISFEPSSGSITTGQAAVKMRVNRDNLEVGNYSTRVTVDSDGGSKFISVSMDVEESPELSVSEREINFGSTLTSYSFEISNIGNGNLSWKSEIMYIQSADNINWLQMTPTEGEISTGSQTIKLSVDKSDLPAGQHNADIQIYSDGGNATIHLYMSNDSPNIEVSTTLLDFGETETEKTFNINNTGGGELSWELSKDVSWISASPISGTTTSETDIITVKVDRDLSVSTLAKNNKRNKKNKLTESYTGNITVSSNAESKIIVVKMGIPESPQLQVSHSSIDFGSSVNVVVLQIQNTGGGTLNWGLILDVDWLHIDAANGETTTETDEVTLTAIRDLTPGIYEGNIRVTWDNGETNIPVKIEIIATN